MLISSLSYDEYVAMFALDDDDLSGSILDCSAGAAGFVTVARSLGAKSLAVDPAYGLSRDDLAAAVRDDLLRGTSIAEQHADRFVWDWYGSREARDRMRRAAAARFLASL